MYQKHLYGNVVNPQTYQNEQGVYQLIDDSYDTQTESGEWKRVPRETSYDQMGGYFLYGGQGSEMSDTNPFRNRRRISQKRLNNLK
ncbi:MAG: hypothetical protein VZQ98_18720 [Bacteroidales bacterium]|nr:hypothetical protein [Bacteroidales bacterium]